MKFRNLTKDEWNDWVDTANLIKSISAEAPHVGVLIAFPLLVDNLMNAVKPSDKECMDTGSETTKQKVLESASYVMWQALSLLKNAAYISPTADSKETRDDIRKEVAEEISTMLSYAMQDEAAIMVDEKYQPKG